MSMQETAAVVIDWEASACCKGGTTMPHLPEEDDQDSKKGKTIGPLDPPEGGVSLRSSMVEKFP